MSEQPFVTVVTPVYNGEAYLAEAIESVLGQNYTNWEYIIVNNCSTDGTLGIAEEYARLDRRIRIVTNKVFVNAEENHNNAFRLISPLAEYCKVVSADDRLLPQCISKMVLFAKAHPSVGFVGSYQQSGTDIKWKGIPEKVHILSGHEVCRLDLLKDIHVLGNPTSTLYRADLLRRTSAFFPHSEPHADTSACYAHLHSCDFGFLHEVLSIERIHPGQITSGAKRLHKGNAAFLEILIQYGPLYLNKTEFQKSLKEVMTQYYRWLGGCVLKLNGREFWHYHRIKLKKLGYPLSWLRVSFAVFQELAAELRQPILAFRKLSPAFRDRQESSTL
jgi:glycosyltransferase involved in cell wall biosynthesis